ncbi:putative Quinone oxidoreductase-like protein, partial [Naja naja]
MVSAKTTAMDVSGVKRMRKPSAARDASSCLAWRWNNIFGLKSWDPISPGSIVFLQSQRTYRAVLCTELKKPLVVRDVPSALLQSHEVRIHVRCCGVNFADILACQGLYQYQHPLPFIPGMEYSGDVVETGKAVTNIKEGDCVIGVTNAKALAEEYITDSKLLWKIPQGVPYEQAAALPVIAAVGSDSKCHLAIQKGAVESVNYNKSSLKEEVKKLTANKGVDVVIDLFGGDIFKQALHSLAFEGRIVVVGFAGGTIPSIPANILLLKNISALGLFWGRYWNEAFPVFSSTISSALSYYQEGQIQPHIGGVFKLEE